MKYITIKTETYSDLVDLIMNTYHDALYRAYNEHLKQLKNIVYSSIDLIPVSEYDMCAWLHDKLFEYGSYNALKNRQSHDLGFLNLPIVVGIDL